MQRRLAERGYRIERIDERIERVKERLERQRLRYLMSACAIEHVVDVGANVGQFARHVRAEGFTGRIDSLEPVEASYTKLAATMRGDRAWHGHHLAASDRVGTVLMHVYPESVLASVTPMTGAGSAVFGADQNLAVVRTEEVERVPLDEVSLPEIGPVFLKIDTQGHDWSVLNGARGLLNRVVMLSIELSFVGLYEEAVPAWKSMEQLASMGFHLAAIDTTVCPADDPLLIGEADGVFIRRDR